MYPYRRRSFRFGRRDQRQAAAAVGLVLVVAAAGASRAAASPGHHHHHSHPPAAAGHESRAAARVIAFARARIGCPYVWGGTGPCSSGYDCSGLVMQAWASAGVNVPRTSEAQWAHLPRVSWRGRRPGDLVFFAGGDGTTAAPGHVGLIIGRRSMIEAYATGYPVRISQYGTPASAPGDGQVVGVARP